MVAIRATRIDKSAGSGLVLLALIAGLVAVVPFAEGSTFPGLNGKIAFQTGRDGNQEIYTINPNGTNPTNLTNNPASDSEPRWSPDGTKVLFVSDRDGNSEIYVMNADGSGVQRLTNDPTIDRMPAWSPRGDQILWSRLVPSPVLQPSQYDIYKMNIDGTGVVNLTNDGSTDWNPAWAADGSRIAFQTNRDGNFEIYAMAPDGAMPTNLTNHPDADIAPHWSPDSTKIVFSSTRVDGATGDIFLMNANGTNQSLISVSQGASDNRASFSPDGDRIVFSSNRLDSDFELFTISRSGVNDPDYRLVRTTRSPGFDQSPDWQPLAAPPPPPPGGVDSITDTAAAGDSVTTDATTGGPTQNDVVETTVTVPTERNVSIQETSNSSQPDPNVSFAGGDINISVPDATPDMPLRLFFAIDSSQAETGNTEEDAVVYRNGVEILPCEGPGAFPDPCIARRGRNLQGDVFIAVLSSAGSTWNAGLKPPRQIGGPGPGPSTPPPTVTESASPSPSPTVATDPPCAFFPTPCPTETPTPTPSETTPTPSPTAHVDRTITFEASKNRVKFGKSRTLSGVVVDDDLACTAGISVMIRRAVGGTGTEQTFATVTTGPDGAFAHTFSPSESAAYVAHAEATTACGEANSTAETINVKVDVDLSARRSSVRSGDRVTLKVTVAPCGGHAGMDVVLKKRTEGDFERAGRDALNDSCVAKFSKRIRRVTAFRARWPKQDEEHEAGRSESVAVSVR